MKTGKSLIELATTLTHIRDTARDFVVPAASMVAEPDAKDVRLSFALKEESVRVGLNSWSHGQLASYSDIPRQYYDRLRSENAALAAQNINHGLAKQNGDKRMLRTVDGNMRAIVSPKYRRLDGADLLDSTLPALIDAGMEVVSSDLTDRRLYLRATTPKLMGEVAKGDVVQAGIMISNSDVGAGSLRVEPFIVRLVCLNGMVMEHALKKAHLGRSLAVGDDTIELLTESTIRLGEKAFWAEVQDVVKACLSPEMFNRSLDRMKESLGVKITNYDLKEVVELTCRRIGLAGASEATKTSIMDALASGNQGAGLTKWGLANAFTAAAAAEHLDFDTSVELERAGCQVLDLKPADWKVVAERRA